MFQSMMARLFWFQRSDLTDRCEAGGFGVAVLVGPSGSRCRRQCGGRSPEFEFRRDRCLEVMTPTGKRMIE